MTSNRIMHNAVLKLFPLRLLYIKYNDGRNKIFFILQFEVQPNACIAKDNISKNTIKVLKSLKPPHRHGKVAYSLLSFMRQMSEIIITLS